MILHSNRIKRDEENGVCLPVKYKEIIKRRFQNQNEFRVPFLGCQECIANVEWVDDFDKAVEENMESEMKTSGEIDYGFMRSRMKFRNGGRPVNDDWDNPVWNETADATFYHAVMNNGIINAEEESYA